MAVGTLRHQALELAMIAIPATVNSVSFVDMLVQHTNHHCYQVDTFIIWDMLY